MTEETLYRIVFNGETVPGLTAQQIIDAFAKRFQIREEKAREILLSGTRAVLKRNLDQHRAHRYSSALQKVGLLVVMEPQNPNRFKSNLSVEINPSIDIVQSELASSIYEHPSSMSEPSAAPPEPAVTPGATAAAAPTRAGPGLTEDWARCPKCGEPAVSPLTGVCQACGLVVERYLARRAEQTDGNGRSTGKGKNKGPARAENPYTPPAAALKARGPAGTESPREPRAVSPWNAWQWIKTGFTAFGQAPGAWLTALLIFGLINGTAKIIEITAGTAGTTFGLGLTLGASVLSMMVGQIVIGGLMIGLERLRNDHPFTVPTVFQGFATAPGPLAVLGLTYLGAVILIVAVAGGIAVAGDAVGPEKTMNPVAWFAIGVAILGFLAIWMMFTFAPALVAVGGERAMQALAMSLRGCVRNLPAGIFYWTLWVLIGIGLTLGLVIAGTILSLLGSPQSPARIVVGLAAFIGLIVFTAYLMAAMIGSIYAAYRDIFHR